MSVEKAPENISSIDAALNTLWEWVEKNIYIHEIFWWLDDENTQEVSNILEAALKIA